jgi:hypothetical protein
MEMDSDKLKKFSHDSILESTKTMYHYSTKISWNAQAQY